MLAMRHCVPDSEMLILNHAGMSVLDNHFLAHHEGEAANG
jgi:hypothetical protein